MAAYRNNNDEDDVWNETLGVSRSQGSSSDSGGGKTKPGSSGSGNGVGVTWSPGLESPRVRQGAYAREHGHSRQRETEGYTSPMVGPDICCSPRRSLYLKLSSLESISIL